jgi:uncharacterized protein YceK
VGRAGEILFVGERLSAADAESAGVKNEVSRTLRKIPAMMPVFFYLKSRLLMRVLLVIAMALLLSGCGSIISRTVPGQGHGNQYYPGVQWDVRDSAWRYITILDLPFSLVFDTLLPLDASHGPITN